MGSASGKDKIFDIISTVASDKKAPDISKKSGRMATLIECESLESLILNVENCMNFEVVLNWVYKQPIIFPLLIYSFTGLLPLRGKIGFVMK